MQDTTIRVWSRADSSLVRVLAGHRGPVNAIQLRESTLVSASGDSLIKLWDINTGEVLRVLSGHTRGLACVQISPSGNLLASGSNDQTIKLWNPRTGECIRTFEGHTDLVRSLAFDEGRKRLVSGSYDKTARLVSCVGGEGWLGRRGVANYRHFGAIAVGPRDGRAAAQVQGSWQFGV